MTLRFVKRAKYELDDVLRHCLGCSWPSTRKGKSYMHRMEMETDTVNEEIHQYASRLKKGEVKRLSPEELEYSLHCCVLGEIQRDYLYQGALRDRQTDKISGTVLLGVGLGLGHIASSCFDVAVSSSDFEPIVSYLMVAGMSGITGMIALYGGVFALTRTPAEHADWRRENMFNHLPF